MLSFEFTTGKQLYVRSFGTYESGSQRIHLTTYGFKSLVNDRNSVVDVVGSGMTSIPMTQPFEPFSNVEFMIYGTGMILYNHIRTAQNAGSLYITTTRNVS